MRIHEPVCYKIFVKDFLPMRDAPQDLVNATVLVLDSKGVSTGFRGRVTHVRRTVLGVLYSISGSGRRLELTRDRIMVVPGEPLPAANEARPHVEPIT